MNPFESDVYFYHAIATNLDVGAETAIKIPNDSIADACRVKWEYDVFPHRSNDLQSHNSA